MAVSLASDDRAYVEEVVRLLRDAGVSVFYDKDDEARLWGRSLRDELVSTYGRRAFRVLLFVSKHYLNKRWPREERRAALARLTEKPDEPFILPVKLDDTDLPGLPKTVTYLDGRAVTPLGIAEMMIQHLAHYGRLTVADGRVRPSDELARRVSLDASVDRGKDKEGTVHYTISNGGDYGISNVVLVIDDPGQKGSAEDQMGTATEIVIGSLPVGKVIEGTDQVHFLTRSPAFGELTRLGILLFTDSWGQHWATNGARWWRRQVPARLC